MSTTTGKNVGLWLDHVQAQFVDVSKALVSVDTVFSEEYEPVHFDGETGIGTKLSETRSTNNEAHQHNRKADMRLRYFHLLADRLQHYDGILLIGPGTAPHELKNLIADDAHFRDKTVTLEACDYITENQLMAKVLKHFGY